MDDAGVLGEDAGLVALHEQVVREAVGLGQAQLPAALVAGRGGRLLAQVVDELGAVQQRVRVRDQEREQHRGERERTAVFVQLRFQLEKRAGKS